jgi:sulfatase modifying factor 1
MKAKLFGLFIGLPLFAGIQHAAAQSPAQGGSRFFRISGPGVTTITSFRSDGTMVWSNAQTGVTYTVQTASLLSGISNWVDYIQIPVTNGLNTNRLLDPYPPSGMVFIPAGVFTMGNLIGDGLILDALPTNVYVSAFYMDVTLITSNQWASAYSYGTNHGYIFADSSGIPTANTSNQPVYYVDWYACVKWCNARSQQAGLTPVYYTDTNFTQIYKTGDLDISNANVNWSANGYRLPTEAEWEKAARGGLSGKRYPWGNTISESQANYDGYTNSGLWNYDLGPNGYNANFDTQASHVYTSPVTFFAPNGYGLYDMAGNLLEWCWDWYAPPPYPAGSAYLGGTDPHGSSLQTNYMERVLRTGSWNNYADFEGCALRNFYDPYIGGPSYGFRCVRGH